MEQLKRLENELHKEERELTLLEIEKEKIFSKYFPLTSENYESAGGSTQNLQNNKMIEYNSELYDTEFRDGKSLGELIIQQRNKVNAIKYQINKIKHQIEIKC